MRDLNSALLPRTFPTDFEATVPASYLAALALVAGPGAGPFENLPAPDSARRVT